MLGVPCLLVWIELRLCLGTLSSDDGVSRRLEAYLGLSKRLAGNAMLFRGLAGRSIVSWGLVHALKLSYGIGLVFGSVLAVVSWLGFLLAFVSECLMDSALLGCSTNHLG